MFTVYFYCSLFFLYHISFDQVQTKEKGQSLIGQCQPLLFASFLDTPCLHTGFFYQFIWKQCIQMFEGSHPWGLPSCSLQISSFCDHSWSGPPNVKSCDDLAHYNGSGHSTAIWVKICSTINWKIPLLCLVSSFALFSPGPRSSYSKERWSGGRFVGGYGCKWGSNCGFPLQRYHSSCFSRHLV